MIFRVDLVPHTMSPLIRDMHRQHRQIEARSEREARKLVLQWLSDDWFIEKVTGE